MLNTSYTKPTFNYNLLLIQSVNLFDNSFVQRIKQKKSQNYIKHFSNAQKLTPYYNYSYQFTTLYNHDWIFIFGIMLLIFLTFIKVHFPQVIKKQIASVINFKFAIQLVNDKSSIIQKSFCFLLVLYVLSLTLFLTASIYYFYPESIHNPYLFIIVLSFVLIFYILKILLYLFIAYLTDNMVQTKLILLHHSVYYRNFALFLTPLSIAIFFIHMRIFTIFFALMALLFVFFSAMRIYRAIILSLQMKFSYLFIFLYLCTIEIIPLLYSYKMLLIWI